MFYVCFSICISASLLVARKIKNGLHSTLVYCTKKNCLNIRCKASKNNLDSELSIVKTQTSPLGFRGVIPASSPTSTNARIYRLYLLCIL